MASIKIAGDAIVVTSAVSLDTIRKIEKYRPEALILRGGEDGKEEIYRIGVATDGRGKLNKYGVEFNSDDSSGNASVTMMHGCTNDVVAEVADKFGAAIVKINAIEDSFQNVLEQIDADRAAVMACITVI